MLLIFVVILLAVLIFLLLLHYVIKLQHHPRRFKWYGLQRAIVWQLVSFYMKVSLLSGSFLHQPAVALLQV